MATLPTDFSWLCWWKWVGTPSAAFHTIWSVDDNVNFNAVDTPVTGGTGVTASVQGVPVPTTFVDPGLNWVCLAGINRGGNGSDNIFLARFVGERRWSTRVGLISAAVRAGSLFLFNESAIDQPSTGIMKGWKMWNEAKTENSLLFESFQLDPVDATAIWSYPEMLSVAGAGRDMRGTGRTFASSGTFVADGREPPVDQVRTSRMGWLRGLRA